MALDTSKFPRLTFLHTRRDLLPFCYRLADALTRPANDIIALSFRSPIADMLNALLLPVADTWKPYINLQHPDVADSPIPFTHDMLTVRNAIEALERTIALNFSADFLGEITARTLASTFLDRSRFLLWDATDPAWLRSASNIVGADHCLCLHFFDTLPSHAEREAIKRLPIPYHSIAVDLDDPTPIDSALNAIGRNL